MKFGIFSEIQAPKPFDKDDWEPGQEARQINEAVDQLVFADSLGFDYIFQVEHHFAHEYSHSSAPEVILGALAGRTKNIRLGTGITHMPPPINHPARVAERIATLDVLSNGRVEFGTGSGATPPEITAFGVPVTEKREMWREATEHALRMMSERLYPGHEGKYFSMPEREIIPKPLQRPHPPVWMACGRRDNIAQAGRLGMGALGFYFDEAKVMADVVEEYWAQIAACEKPIGSVMNPAMIATASMMCCPTREEALAKGSTGADFFAYAIGRYGMEPTQNLWRAFMSRTPEEVERMRSGRIPTGEELAQTLAAGAMPIADEIERNLRMSLTADTFTGSPEMIKERLRPYEEANVDAIIFLIQCGDRRHEDIMESLELFSKEVMPEFKDRHHKQQSWRKEKTKNLKFPVNSSI